MANYKIISVASSKGGIGKSTVSLGIARALAHTGKKVLLADLDFGNACLDILCGVEDRILYTVIDLVAAACTTEDAVLPMSDENLWLLPAPAAGLEDAPEGDHLSKALKKACEDIEADYLVLDTGAGVTEANDAAFSISDTVLVVAGHSPVSIRAAESTGNRIHSINKAIEVKLIINSFDIQNLMSRRLRNRTGMFSIIDESGITLAGVIPYDYELELAAELPRMEYSYETNTAFSNIAARLLGKSTPLFHGLGKIRRKKKLLFS